MPVEGSTSNELFTHSSTIPSIQERKNQLNKSIAAQNKTSVTTIGRPAATKENVSSSTVKNQMHVIQELKSRLDLNTSPSSKQSAPVASQNSWVSSRIESRPLNARIIGQLPRRVISTPEQLLKANTDRQQDYALDKPKEKAVDDSILTKLTPELNAQQLITKKKSVLQSVASQFSKIFNKSDYEKITILENINQKLNLLKINLTTINISYFNSLSSDKSIPLDQLNHLKTHLNSIQNRLESNLGSYLETLDEPTKTALNEHLKAVKQTGFFDEKVVDEKLSKLKSFDLIKTLSRTTAQLATLEKSVDSITTLPPAKKMTTDPKNRAIQQKGLFSEIKTTHKVFNQKVNAQVIDKYKASASTGNKTLSSKLSPILDEIVSFQNMSETFSEALKTAESLTDSEQKISIIKAFLKADLKPFFKAKSIKNQYDLLNKNQKTEKNINNLKNQVLSENSSIPDLASIIAAPAQMGMRYGLLMNSILENVDPKSEPELFALTHQAHEKAKNLAFIMNES